MAVSSIKRGALVVFEGCDRCGKTTQCKKLGEYLIENKHNVYMCRFPDRSTKIGSVINDYLSQQADLDDRAIHLLFSANRWEQMSKVRELIHKGVTVIVDRYAFSGVAFSAAKKNLSLSWCKQTDVGLPRPDLVLYLHLSPSEAALRGDWGRERYERTEFQDAVHANYMQLMEKHYWKVIDAAQDIDVIHSEIREVVLQTMEDVGDKPLETLWDGERPAAEPTLVTE